MAPFSAPDTPTPAPVVCLADTQTGENVHLLAHLQQHGNLTIRDRQFFPVAAIDDRTYAVEQRHVVAALTTAAEQGWGLALPMPQDLGTPHDYLAVLGVAAQLGVPVFVGPHAEPWRSQMLPGLSTVDIVSILADGWRRFLGCVGGELLTTQLALTVGDLPATEWDDDELIPDDLFLGDDFGEVA